MYSSESARKWPPPLCSRSGSDASLPASCSIGSLSEVATLPSEDRPDGEPEVTDVSESDTHQSAGSTSEDTSPGPPTDRTSSDGRCSQQGAGEEPPREQEATLTRTFHPYDHPKSTSQVNAAVKAELLKAHPTTEGHIYGFLHPEPLVRLGTGAARETPLLKIGRTTDVARRMKQWRKQCRYAPAVVLARATAHHQRIERLVHHQLHNSRLREARCPGCGAQHTEWFRVSAVYAAHLVGLWQAFARRRPYDEFGALRPCWRARLARVDLDDPGCWMWFVLAPPGVEGTCHDAGEPLGELEPDVVEHIDR